MEVQQLIPLRRAQDDYDITGERLRRAIKDGHLKGHAVGRAVLVDRGELEEWIKTHSVREEEDGDT